MPPEEWVKRSEFIASLTLSIINMLIIAACMPFLTRIRYNPEKKRIELLGAVS